LIESTHRHQALTEKTANI